MPGSNVNEKSLTKSKQTTASPSVDSKTSSSSASNPTVMHRTAAEHPWRPGPGEEKFRELYQTAKPADFQPGRILYVRNRKATCNRFEYPLVYFTFEGETLEKHRSFSADPDQFMVPRTEDSSNSKSSEKTTTSATTTTAPTSTSSEKAAAKSFQAGGKGSGEDNPFEAELEDVMFAKKKDACEDCTLNLPEEVASLTLRNCRNVRATFASLSNSCTVDNSAQCILRCTTSCSKYVVMSSPGTLVKFPKDAESVEWYTALSKDIKLEALDRGGTAAETLVINPDPQGDQTSTYQTRYQKGAFQKPVKFP
eukprot:g65234.t1